MMRAPYLYCPLARAPPKKKPPKARGSSSARGVLRKTSPRVTAAPVANRVAVSSRPNPKARMMFEEENELIEEAAPLFGLDNAMYPVLEIVLSMYKWTRKRSETPAAVLRQSSMIDYLLALLEHATAMDEDVNVRLSNKLGGATCLHLATLTRSLKCVRTLVSAGARVDSLDEKRRTPLHCAVNANSLSIIRFLCKVRRCLPQQRDALGNLPIHYAAWRGWSDIFAFLFPFTKPDSVGHNGKTLLHFACQGGANDIVIHLLKAYADPSASSNHGYTALHYAAAQGQVHTVKILMTCSPRLANIRDCFGRTAQELAFHRGCVNHEMDVLLSWRNSGSGTPRRTPRRTSCQKEGKN